jgi:predicted O-methyltransferase YrrM
MTGPNAAAASPKGGYQFTKDYITNYVDIWTRHLGEFRGKPDIHFLEVGTFEGRTAIWFLDNILTDPSSTITCIDFFENPGTEERFDHNIAVSGRSGRVIKLYGKSEDILPIVRRKLYDAIYVDAGHRADEVHSDATLCWPLLKVGGVIGFDDYEWRLHRRPEDRPQQAVDRFLEEHRNEVAIVHKGYTVLAKRLK